MGPDRETRTPFSTSVRDPDGPIGGGGVAGEAATSCGTVAVLVIRLRVEEDEPRALAARSNRKLSDRRGWINGGVDPGGVDTEGAGVGVEADFL